MKHKMLSVAAGFTAAAAVAAAVVSVATATHTIVTHCIDSVITVPFNRDNTSFTSTFRA